MTATSPQISSTADSISLDFSSRVAIAERMAYVIQFINHCENAEDLKWIRNRLSEPHGAIMKKLDKMGELAKDDKNHLRESNVGK